MSLFSNLFERTVGRFLGRLRFPALFSLTLAVFLIDVFVPDVVPFVDEILLALGSLVLGSLKKKVERGGEKKVERGREKKVDGGGPSPSGGDDDRGGSGGESGGETSARPSP